MYLAPPRGQRGCGVCSRLRPAHAELHAIYYQICDRDGAMPALPCAELNPRAIEWPRTHAASQLSARFRASRSQSQARAPVAGFNLSTRERSRCIAACICRSSDRAATERGTPGSTSRPCITTAAHRTRSQTRQEEGAQCDEASTRCKPQEGVLRGVAPHDLWRPSLRARPEALVAPSPTCPGCAVAALLRLAVAAVLHLHAWTTRVPRRAPRGARYPRDRARGLGRGSRRGDDGRRAEATCTCARFMTRTRPLARCTAARARLIHGTASGTCLPPPSAHSRCVAPRLGERASPVDDHVCTQAPATAASASSSALFGSAGYPPALAPPQGPFLGGAAPGAQDADHGYSNFFGQPADRAPFGGDSQASIFGQAAYGGDGYRCSRPAGSAAASTSSTPARLAGGSRLAAPQQPLSHATPSGHCPPHSFIRVEVTDPQRQREDASPISVPGAGIARARLEAVYIVIKL